MNLTANPYQSPTTETGQIQDRQTGFWFLAVGIATFAICAIVVGFVMIFVIPEMKAAYAAIGRTIPSFVEWIIHIADHCVRFWFWYLMAMACGLILIERSGTMRKQLRIGTGIALFTISLTAAMLAIFASMLALN